MPIKSQITLPNGQTWVLNNHGNIKVDSMPTAAWWSVETIRAALKHDVVTILVGSLTKRELEALTHDERTMLLVWIGQNRINDGGWS